MSLKGIKLVSFDATNTLLKFRMPPWHFYAAVAQKHGFQGDPTDLRQGMLSNYKAMWNKHPNFGRDTISWQNWWKQVVISTLESKLPKTADLNSIAHQLIKEFATSKCWCLADGTKDLLHLLRSKGLAIGVISNFDPRLQDILKNVDIHSNFDFIVTSYEAGFSKPDHRIFKFAMDKTKRTLETSESLHIGDDLTKDYDGARAAGWHALLINKKFKQETPPAYKHVFIDLKQLMIAIENDTLKL